MKKIVTLFVFVFLLSCSKEDDGTLPITSQNFKGLWNFKSIVKDDGTLIPYVGDCSTQKDYIDIYSSGQLGQRYYYSNCADINYNIIDYALAEDHRIYSISSFLFDGAIIKKITKTNIELEFDEPRNVVFLSTEVSNCKKIIFEKR